MKKYFLLFAFVMASLFAFGQKSASYTDYMLSSGYRVMGSNPFTVYLEWTGNESVYYSAKCQIMKAMKDDNVFWWLRLGISNEGRFHVEKKSPLYFGYPNNGVCVPVVTIYTDEGTPGLLQGDYVEIDYTITEEQIKTLIASNQLAQVLITTSDGNIGRILYSGFQKNLKKQYDFIQKISNEKCKNVRRNKTMK